jgi:hypothetical protein
MTAKIFFASALAFIGTAPLCAQSRAPLQAANMDDADLSNVIGLLEQNALLALLSIVFLMGVAWFCGLWKACADLNKPQSSARPPSLLLLLALAAGLGTVGSSCTAAQQARAADIRAARDAEGGICVCNIPYNNRSYNDYTGINKQYFDQDLATGKPFCRHCGLRIYQRNH